MSQRPQLPPKWNDYVRTMRMFRWGGLGPVIVDRPFDWSRDA